MPPETTPAATTSDPPATPSRPRRAARRAAAVLIWLAVAAWALLTATRLFGAEFGWLPSALVAFTPQAAAAAVPAAAGLILLRRRRSGLVLAGCALALAAAVLPRVFPAQQPEVAGPVLRVLTANLQVGSADVERLAEIAADREIDLLSIQELTERARAAFAAAGGRELFPHAVIETGEAADGTAIYSRHPLTRLPELEPGGIFRQPAAAVAIPAAPPVEFMAVHPAAPREPSRIPLWEADLRALPPPDPQGPIRLLAGDFNATLDHRLLRELLAAGYADASDESGAGLRPTWRPEAGGVRIPAAVLDRVLVDERVAFRDYRVLESIGGDHLPVFAEVRLPAA